jgi:hypothetical protein
MRNFILICLCIWGVYTSAMAQNEQAAIKTGFQPFEIGVSLGLAPGIIRNSGIGDVNAFVPGSILMLKANELEKRNFVLGSQDALLQVWAGFKLNRKREPLLRLGLSYSTMQNDLSWYALSNEFVYDTLRSANGSHTVFADSLYEQWLGVEQFSQQLRADGAMIWHSKSRGQFSLFAGVGAQFGFSVLSRSRVTYHHMAYQRYRSESDTLGRSFWSNRNNLESSTEIFENGLQFVSSVYAPLGINLRLGAAGTNLDRAQLFLQVSPTFTWLYVPEQGWVAGGQVFAQLGLRFAL